MRTNAALQGELRNALLERLSKLSAPGASLGTVPHGASSGVKVFGYCVLERECVSRARFEDPALVVVLSGTKEVWRGEVSEHFSSGLPFVVPANMDLDFVNVPDPNSGRYESICITVDPQLRQVMRASSRGLKAGPTIPGSFAVSLTPDLVEAYGHAASALSDLSPAVAASITRHRILEILLLLRETQVWRVLAAASLPERVEAVVYSDPGRAWRVDEIACALNLGASTLRRHMKNGGTSIREILLSARMAAAHTLLMSPHSSVTQAAQAAGYASRSHFARRFRAVHGTSPSRLRSVV